MERVVNAPRVKSRAKKGVREGSTVEGGLR